MFRYEIIVGLIYLLYKIRTGYLGQKRSSNKTLNIWRPREYIRRLTRRVLRVDMILSDILLPGETSIRNGELHSNFQQSSAPRDPYDFNKSTLT